MAIDGGHADPEHFALIRVFAGGLVLTVVAVFRRNHLPIFRKSRIVGALSLTAYMLGFSLAYLTLDAGVGALILFGVVQITMFGYGVMTGSGPTARQYIGAMVAFLGLLLALWPGANGQTDTTGAAFMVLAGIGWAAYTLSGRSAGNPLAATGANFLICFPLLALFFLTGDTNTTTTGWILAFVCGGLTSGLGYALWYSVLPDLQPSVAAIVQLSVPVIAIVGGAVFLSEQVSITLGAATLLVLSGIALAVTSRSFPTRHK